MKPLNNAYNFLCSFIDEFSQLNLFFFKLMQVRVLKIELILELLYFLPLLDLLRFALTVETLSPGCDLRRVSQFYLFALLPPLDVCHMKVFKLLFILAD